MSRIRCNCPEGTCVGTAPDHVCWEKCDRATKRKGERAMRSLHVSWRIFLNVLILWPLMVFFKLILAVLRNPSHKLKYVKFLDVTFRKDKVNFVGLNGLDDMHPFSIGHFRSVRANAFSSRVTDSIWFFAWCGPLAGFWWLKILDDEHYRQFRIGWKIMPHDCFEIPKSRQGDEGFVFQFPFKRKG